MKVSWALPESPSVIVASAIDSVGSTGEGTSPEPLRIKPVAALPPAPEAAWKPKLASPPAGTLAFHAALRTT